MKKLLAIFGALIVCGSTSATMISCLPNEIQIHYSQIGYEYLNEPQTTLAVPRIKNKIATFENQWMRNNISGNLYFHLNEDEINEIEIGQNLNERQKDILIDTLSANLRIYKILDEDKQLDASFFDAHWIEFDNSNKHRFKVDVMFKDNIFVTLFGEYFVSDTNSIDEINEVTFTQIADLAKDNNKIITSSVGAFWGADFIGDKYNQEEQDQMWAPGGKYEDYVRGDKLVMTWKGDQKINIDSLEHTMTDYVSSRLRLSGTIQSNLELKHEEFDFNITNFAGGSEQFVCKTDAIDCTPTQNITMIDRFDEEFFYFSQDHDFGAKTLIQVQVPTISYKGRPDVTIQQGGSIFQSHIDYKW